MGMFDYINYKGQQYQTKDTPAQMMDSYEIRDDGTLWYESYDAEWVESEGFFGGHIERNNIRWEPVEHTGIIRFYRAIDSKADDWEEYASTFSKGKMVYILEI